MSQGPCGTVKRKQMPEHKDHNYIKWFVIAVLISPIVIAAYFILYVNVLGGVVFAVVIFGCIAAALGIHLRVWKKYHYICPVCVIPFKPDFISSLTAMNYFDQRNMKCPKCGKRQLMTAIKDEDAPNRQFFRP